MELYYGYWADAPEIILTVVNEVDGWLIRIIRSERQVDGSRKVLILEEANQGDADSAKQKAIELAQVGQVIWREYADLGRLISLL